MDEINQCFPAFSLTIVPDLDIFPESGGASYRSHMPPHLPIGLQYASAQRWTGQKNEDGAWSNGRLVS